MDSPRVKEYKKQIQTLFSRTKVHGFVDWWHMGPLTRATFSDDQWREETEQRLYPAVWDAMTPCHFSKRKNPMIS